MGTPRLTQREQPVQSLSPRDGRKKMPIVYPSVAWPTRPKLNRNGKFVPNNSDMIQMKPLCLMCCCDIGAYSTSLWCPCTAHGKIAEAIGRDYDEECCFYFGSCRWPIADAWYHAGVSKKLLRQHGIEASTRTLCCKHLWFRPCALAQELNFIKRLKAAGFINAQGVTVRGPQRQTMRP